MKEKIRTSFQIRPLELRASILAVCVLAFATASNISANVVADWNAAAVSAALASGRGPSSYIDLAYTHISMYDAVNSIDGHFSVFAVSPSNVPVGASKEAAAAAAAYRVLITLYPAQQMALDAQYAASLAAIPGGQSKTDGVAIGTEVASLFLASRAGDGRNAPITYTPGSGPGAWIPTPPAFLPPLFPWVAQMRPFAMNSSSQFRGDGPPALTSAQYAEDFNEVKSLGDINSVTRTPEQTEIGLFYTDSAIPQTGRAFRKVATDKGLDLADSARFFAQLYVTLADSLIGSFETKYHYGFWRPVTAIQAADTDGNPETTADTNWTPLVVTPNFPDYVSTHATTWGGFSETLRQFFGTKKVNFTMTSNVTHTTHNFDNVDAIQKEIIDARVYAGIHFRTADVQGVAMGKKIAKYVAKNYFLSR